MLLREVWKRTGKKQQNVINAFPYGRILFRVIWIVLGAIVNKTFLLLLGA